MNVVTVGDISEQVRGVSYSKGESSEESRPNYVAVLRANNITDGGLTFDDLVYVPEARVSAKQRIRAHDVVIAASSGSLSVVGKAAQARHTVDGSFGAFCKVLRPNGKVDPRYFGHFFRTHAYRRKISRLAAGANINNLKNEHLDSLPLPLPPLPVQTRIGAILDAADALRAKRRESIDQLDSLIQATFLEMFGDPVTNPKGWEMSTIGNCVDVLSGHAFKSSDFTSDGVPLIRISNLKGSSVNLAGCARIPEPKQGHLSKYRIQAGDTLIAMSGATTGKLGFVPTDLTETWYLNQRVGLFRFRRDSKIRTQFLRAVLSSSFYQRHVWHLAAGVAQPNISAGQLESAFIPVAPLDLQTRFVSIVESVEHQKSRLKAHLTELDTLFASLQSRAFNGELVA